MKARTVRIFGIELTPWILAVFAALVAFVVFVQWAAEEKRQARSRVQELQVLKRAPGTEGIYAKEGLRVIIKKHPQGPLARIRCEDYVQARLKAPTTAEFPVSGWSVVHLGDWVYEVSSYVDAENTFGARIRTSFVCEVRCSNIDECVVSTFKMQ